MSCSQRCSMFITKVQFLFSKSTSKFPLFIDGMGRNVCHTFVKKRVFLPALSLSLLVSLCRSLSSLIESILSVNSVVFIHSMSNGHHRNFNWIQSFCLHHCIYRSFSELVKKKHALLLQWREKKQTWKEKFIFIYFFYKKKGRWRSKNDVKKKRKTYLFLWLHC